ncbi:MAG: DUF2490 domain-containing protein [Spirochaetes bacterium]|nr:DUF2490 domain-containing protein [Spirochaetota bacterium]
MKKGKFLAIVFFLAMAFTALISAVDVYAAVPTYGRTWEYFNLNILLSPNWAFTVMPGHRYEFYDDTQPDNEGRGNQFYELFTGPIYINKLNDNVTFKLPLWYYYMGFPNMPGATSGRDNDYYYSHNFEVVPIFEVKIGSFLFINRIILHNKFYANNRLYNNQELRRGWSLLMREMVSVLYFLNDTFALSIGDEVFIGLVEDRGTNEMRERNGKPTIGEPFFEQHGFSMNRFYAGILYRYDPTLSIHPQYILESIHNPSDDYELTKKGHYIFLVITYTLRLY